MHDVVHMCPVIVNAKENHACNKAHDRDAKTKWLTEVTCASNDDPSLGSDYPYLFIEYPAKEFLCALQLKLTQLRQ